MVKHGLDRRVAHPSASSYLLVRFAFSCQPLMGEEPGLIGRDGYKSADCDRPVVVDGKLHLIAFVDVQGTPDLLGKGELRLRADLHACPHPRPSLDLGGWLAHKILRQ